MSQVLAAGQVLVDRGVLAGQADRLAHVAAGRGATSKPATVAPPGVGVEQRGEDAHRRGLAGAVGAEQAEHAAAGHDEVDAVERLHVAVVLDKSGRDNRRVS